MFRKQRCFVPETNEIIAAISHGSLSRAANLQKGILAGFSLFRNSILFTTKLLPINIEFSIPFAGFS